MGVPGQGWGQYWVHHMTKCDFIVETKKGIWGTKGGGGGGGGEERRPACRTCVCQECAMPNRTRESP